MHVRQWFPDFFRRCRVLDVGSLDINGSNRPLFEQCDYLGLDLAPGRNVDVVSRAHEFNAPSESFDTIISTEMLEHDQYYAKSLTNIVRMLRSGGLFLFTCATTGREEHGTSRCHPIASPITSSLEGWEDYYKNLTECDIREVLDVDTVFARCGFDVEETNYDLRFWGIKRVPRHFTQFSLFVGEDGLRDG